MEIVELETNLSLYRAQLQHLDDFPADHTSAGDRAKEMEILREELKELISLTEDALLTSKKQELLAMLQTSDSNADCASTSVDTNTNQVQPSEADMEDDTEDDTLFNELVGTQCSAVFRTSNGAVRRLNAVVFDVDQYSQRCSLFCCTPTERRLVPCRFFLADRCAFDAHSCRYSHGYEASLDELTEYVEPDFALLRSGLRCLARRVPINPSSSSSSSSSDQAESGTDESADAELWQEAVVERVLLGTLACIVRFSGGTCETVPFVNIFPLVEYVVELSDTDSNDEQLEDDDAVIEVSSAGEPVRRKEFAIEISDDEDEVRFVGITNNDKYTAKSSSLTKSSTEMKAAAATPSSVGFGSWERYTSGIGSKLLRRMGYVEGRGLGAGGEGRVEPVPIQVLPSGRTLDEIMRLKAAANDHQLFNVSDTFGCDAADGARLDWALRRIRKLSYHRGKSGNSFPHAKAQRVRSSADNKNGGDVFAFINRRIQEHGPPLAKHGPVIAKQNVKLSVKQLSRRSDRELNVEGLQYERKLRELDTQIANQEATVSRIGSSGAHATQARDRLTKLRALRDETRVAMRRLENHQEARKQNAKFVKF